MKQQLDIFGNVSPMRSFDEDAMGFLISYARSSRGQSFSSEDVTVAALSTGLAPVDLRHWGKVFQQAARDGYIRRSDVLFKRSFGNGSLAPGWVGV